MKKAIKVVSMMMVLIGIMGICGATTGCASSKKADKMYTSQQSRSSVVNKNYKVRGNNKNNRSTYRTY